ncbi:uncharacterized protein A4U43_C10F15820 [Asparagus officinalis]|uniref:Uncharacterized protein n=1 Tax=Asparagus officinalis TaxID=4686 RepID=A0A5P1E6B8_ASPOF|nr:probable leucine-rich repeat receptor-like protein kinase At1g35710 [Asparagus officinalis]ONK57027.1 uncharacterized protein A4U43_C10F15820 [Asparagus officinalis]
MATNSIQFQLVLLFLCIHPWSQLLSNAACTRKDRKALLGFKAEIDDLAGILSSWTGSDCCKWLGVGCDKKTGHVTRLNLRRPDPLGKTLQGNLSSSLLGLRHLRYLDLSLNSFGGISIPSFIGEFKELRYLNLSKSGFVGRVPDELGNLSRLQYLDLQSQSFPVGLYMIDALWISRLTSLWYIDMSGVNLSNCFNLLQALNMLPTVETIHLSLSQMNTIPQSLPHTNFRYLSFLDLSLNDFDSTEIPGFLFSIRSLKHLDLRDSGFRGIVSDAISNLSSLEFLDLSGISMAKIPRSLGSLCNLTILNLENALPSNGLSELGQVLDGCAKDSLQELRLAMNGFSDHIPDWIGDFKNLRILDLYQNNFYGSIPEAIGRLSSLEILGLSRNQLNETVSENIGQLSRLITLDLTFNTLNTTLTEAHFANLKSLKHLDLYNSSLRLNLSSDWFPPFQVEYFYTRGCQFGPKFPSWLRNQRKIQYLDMSGSGITDAMPDWFWNITSHMTELYMSDNQISGKMPKSFSFADNEPVHIDLSYNRLEGALPQLPPNVEGLYLSTNSLSGPIPPTFGNEISNLTYFSISSNNFYGSIPSSLCKLQKLKALDLSKNQFSGEILDCWDKFPDMEYLDLASNSLSGNFPKSISLLGSLKLLDLSNNSLFGPLPDSVECVSVNTLDLSQNNFTGKIPSWISESLPMLRILSLRSNSFIGDIPSNISNLQNLHILDLSSNNFSGSISKNFGNLSSMKVAPAEQSYAYFDDFSWDGLIMKMWVMTKGRYLEYGKLLSLLAVMDFSENNLLGQIPEEITDLHGLQSLNLSGNHFTGNITDKFGDLRLLETLDLSKNELEGKVPASLSGLNFLSHLNLSYNHLQGRIPSGGQMNTFDDSVYAGNDGLCGLPLKVKCDADNGSKVPPTEVGDNGDGHINGMLWYFLGGAPGLVIGFWTVWGALLLNSRWRHAYFTYVDKLCEKFGIRSKYRF